MHQPPITLADFSQFTILRTEQVADRSFLTGRVTKPGRLSRDHWLSLVIGDEDVCAWVVDLDPDEASATLRVETSNLLPSMIVGAKFPVCDSYWIDKLFLVTSNEIQWNKIEFVAPDAFFEPGENAGWRKWQVANPGDENRSDGQIVKGGWDHEHCEICWQHIDKNNPQGYCDGSSNWVCGPCYEKYVGPRDLRFVLENPSDDADGAANELTPFRQVTSLIDDYDLVRIRQFLIDTGYVNVKSKYGWTPLMLAGSNGHQSLVELLLELKADVNAIADLGYTALALAAQKGSLAVVKKLLEAGATVDVPADMCGGSLLTYVRTGPGAQNTEIVALLKSAGAR
jgi:hypothetical protein